MQAFVEENAGLLGDDPFALEELMERLPAREFAARAAVDAALHDLQGKLLGQPVWRLLGLRRAGPPTSWTVWLGDPDDMARRAERALERFHRLKLKLGGRDGLDVERVRAVRGVAGDLPLQVDVNEAWSLDEARGRPIGDVLNLVNEITREPIENPLMCALGRGEAGAPVDHSVLITRSGQEVAIQESAAPICDRQGRVIGAVIVFHDVTKERRLKRALSYQASHDALTGLINRREFDNRLHAAVLSAQRGEGSYALLYIDLDQGVSERG